MEWQWKKETDECIATVTRFCFFDNRGVMRGKVINNSLNEYCLSYLTDKDENKIGPHFPTSTVEEGKQHIEQLLEPERLRAQTGKHPKRKITPEDRL